MFGQYGDPYTSMYGPGVLNDTVVPGYGITKFPVNLPVFDSLSNGTVRAFGEANQYVTYPAGYPNWMYQLAQGFTSPNHISNYNPALFGVMDLTNSNLSNPFLNQVGNSQAYQWGANVRIQMQINQAIQSIANNLNSMETGLENALKNENLTGAQKARLQTLLEEVKTLKKDIENKLKASNPTEDSVAQMQKQVLDLQKKVNEDLEEIGKEIAETQDNTSSDDAAPSEGASSGAAAEQPTLAGTEYEDIDPETGRSTKLGEAPSKAECRQFCSMISTGVDYKYLGFIAGTDMESLEPALNGLNADNIVEVIAYWDENHGKEKEGLIWRVIHDLGHNEKKKFVPMLLNALQTRAEALGIEEDIGAEVTKINKELGDCNISDGIISRKLRSIYDKIKAKEDENKTGAKTALEEKKAKYDAGIAEKKSQVETEKKNELANKMKTALKLDKVPQLAPGLKVETDDNGNFIGYSIEISSNSGKITVKGVTYQQLALEIEKNNLKPEDVLCKDLNA